MAPTKLSIAQYWHCNLLRYTVSGDIMEAARCLAELDVPHFHHELVKRALLAAFGDSSHAASLLKLLHALADSGQVNQVLAHHVLAHSSSSPGRFLCMNTCFARASTAS